MSEPLEKKDLKLLFEGIYSDFTSGLTIKPKVDKILESLDKVPEWKDFRETFATISDQLNQQCANLERDNAAEDNAIVRRRKMSAKVEFKFRELFSCFFGVEFESNKESEAAASLQ